MKDELIDKLIEIGSTIRSNNFLPTVREQFASICDTLATILNTWNNRIKDVEKVAEDINSGEQNRVNAEKSRVSAENARVSAENARASNDSKWNTAESTRVSNENVRISNENSRKSAETARGNAESTRSSAESTRVSNENVRISNENSRKSAETARGNAESTRASAESKRSNAESTRTSAENTRVSNEQVRSTNEVNREQTFLNQETRLKQLEGMAYRGRRDTIFTGNIWGQNNKELEIPLTLPSGVKLSDYDELVIEVKDQALVFKGYYVVSVVDSTDWTPLSFVRKYGIYFDKAGQKLRYKNIETETNFQPQVRKVTGIKY